MDIAIKIYKDHGYKGFLKGILSRIIYVGVGGVFYFVCY